MADKKTIKKKKEDEDEITLAKSIFDEIVEETESEDWEKENKKAASKTPPKNKECSAV